MSELLNAINTLYVKIDDGNARLHHRIDEVQKTLGDVSVKVNTLEHKMPEVPCDFGLETQRLMSLHIDEHKETKKAFFGGAWHIGLEIIAAVVIAYLLLKFGLKG